MFKEEKKIVKKIQVKVITAQFIMQILLPLNVQATF